MVLLRDPREQLEVRPAVLVVVLHADLGEHARHRVGADAPVGRGHRTDMALRLPLVTVLLGPTATAEQTRAGELLDADGEAHVGLARLHGHDHRAQRGGAGGARVGHVVDGDAGLADMLLDLLADTALAHQVAGGEHAHVGHRHATVGERRLHRFGGEVHDVAVVVLAELRHVDAKDENVVTHARIRSVLWVRVRCGSVVSGQAGSKAKPIASTPLSSVPSE